MDRFTGPHVPLDVSEEFNSQRNPCTAVASHVYFSLTQLPLYRMGEGSEGWLWTIFMWQPAGGSRRFP